MKCPQCGTEVEQQYNFCPQCQARLRPDAPDAAHPAEPSDLESPAGLQEPDASGQTPGADPAPGAQHPDSGQQAGGPYVPPNHPSRPQRYGPMPGTAYDYFTEKNRAAAQSARETGGNGAAPGARRPSSPYPTVNYQPPQKHTGLIVAIVIVAVVVIVSLFIGLFGIIRWAEYHYEDDYQYHYDWDDDFWDATSVQKTTVSLPGGFSVTFPDR